MAIINNLEYYASLENGKFRELLPDLDVETLVWELWHNSTELNEVKNELIKYEIFQVRKLIISSNLRIN